LATGFFAAGFAVVFAAVFGAAFLVILSLTPADFATFDRLALRRAAVFFLIRPFLTAVSSSLTAADRVVAVGFAMNAFVADLISFLIPTFLARRLIVCFARLIADLMIGI
jgi:hypothetical protein